MKKLILIAILILAGPCMASDSVKVFLDKCTWINAGSATINYDGSTTYSYGYSWNYRYVWLNGPIDDSVNAYSSYTIDSMRIYSYVSDTSTFKTGDSLIFVAYENLRDAVEDSITWNNYRKDVAWATAGAGGAGTDVSSDSICICWTKIKGGEIEPNDTILLGTLIGSVVEGGIPYGMIWKIVVYYNDDSRPLFESDDDALESHRPWGMIYMTASGGETTGRRRVVCKKQL